jgi:hypothetical protein
METVEVKSPSFPEVTTNKLLDAECGTTWCVMCGDKDHWRTGFYSPEQNSFTQIDRLEKHSCPELFMLLEGSLTLVIEEEGNLKTIILEKNKPILIDTWHNGFCPNGPFTGKALVVERDNFVTEYRTVKDFTQLNS